MAPQPSRISVIRAGRLSVSSGLPRNCQPARRRRTAADGSLVPDDEQRTRQRPLRPGRCRATRSAQGPRTPQRSRGRSSRRRRRIHPRSNLTGHSRARHSGSATAARSARRSNVARSGCSIEFQVVKPVGRLDQGISAADRGPGDPRPVARGAEPNPLADGCGAGRFLAGRFQGFTPATNRVYRRNETISNAWHGLDIRLPGGGLA